MFGLLSSGSTGQTVVTSLAVSGAATFNGNLALGDATSDTITFTGRVNSNILPSADITYDLGSVTNRFRNIYASGGILSGGYLNPDNDNLLYNGDFETGTTSGWTGITSIVTGGVSGNYAGSVTNDTQVLTDDYIPVNPVTDVLQLDAMVKETVTGSTPGILYFGYIAYDASKAVITTAPCGTYCYFAASGYNIPNDGNWHRVTATTTGEGTSMPNFPVGTKYVRVLALANYSSVGGETTLFDHITLKRINNGPLFVGNNFSGTNMTNQNQVSKLYTTAANNLIVESAGNVGINTSGAPASLLSVGGTTGNFQVNSAGAIAASTGINTSGGYTQTGSSANTFTGVTTIGNGSSGTLNLGDGQVTKSSGAGFSFNGDIFLPTNSANLVLGASATSGDRLRLHRSSTNGYVDYGTGSLLFRAGGSTTALTLDASGNTLVGGTLSVSGQTAVTTNTSTQLSLNTVGATQTSMLFANAGNLKWQVGSQGSGNFDYFIYDAVNASTPFGIANNGGTMTVGNAGRTLTISGGASSSINFDGTALSAAELNRLDGKDAALVDTNDAVATAITGTGVLGAGSITSGFGAIDIGADTITSGNVNGQTISSTANFTGTLGVASNTSINGALTVGSNSIQKEFSTSFVDGVANQKVDLYFPGWFWGNIEVALNSTYSNQNAAGAVTKKFYLGLSDAGTVYNNVSRYSDVSGLTADNFAISDVTWDATNTRWRIQLVHRTSTGNPLVINIKANTGDAGSTDKIRNNMGISAVYTTDTTVFSKPVVSFTDDVNLASGALQTAGTTRLTNAGILQNVTYNGTAIGATYGGTGQTGYAVGDLLFANTTTTLGKLAAVASGSCLISAGTNTAPVWGSCGTGLFTDSGTLAYLTQTTDNFTVGSSAAGGKLFVDGDTDEVQLQVQANASQSTDIFVVESSGGTDYLAVTGTGTVVLGSVTNGISITNGGIIDFNGTSRPTEKVVIRPEFPGATISGDGTSNSGTMTSDFCSASGRRNLNIAVCANTGEEHNYYSWTTSSGTNDYDIYTFYTIPSDFDGFINDSTLRAYGWRTTSGEKVEVSIFQANGTQCGTTNDIVVAASNQTWTPTSFNGNETSCSFAAGDEVLLQVKLTATATNYARVGGIYFEYYRKN